MFRFGCGSAFRASSVPQSCFQNGAKSAFYMGQWYSRRHFARMRTPLVNGHLDPKMFAASAVLRSLQSSGGLIAGAAVEGDGAIATSSSSASDLVTSLAMLEELMAAASFCPNWSIRCSFPDWHQLAHTFYVINTMLALPRGIQYTNTHEHKN